MYDKQHIVDLDTTHDSSILNIRTFLESHGNWQEKFSMFFV